MKMKQSSHQFSTAARKGEELLLHQVISLSCLPNPSSPLMMKRLGRQLEQLWRKTPAKPHYGTCPVAILAAKSYSSATKMSAESHPAELG